MLSIESKIINESIEIVKEKTKKETECYLYSILDNKFRKVEKQFFYFIFRLKLYKKNFIIKEEEIFVNPNDKLYRYYQLCPHCGYIVNIPKEILSDGIKQRIEERCSKDDKLFRKMYLYSELFSLDKRSTNDQKKLLRIK